MRHVFYRIPMESDCLQKRIPLKQVPRDSRDSVAGQIQLNQFRRTAMSSFSMTSISDLKISRDTRFGKNPSKFVGMRFNDEDIKNIPSTSLSSLASRCSPVTWVTSRRSSAKVTSALHSYTFFRVQADVSENRHWIRRQLAADNINKTDTKPILQVLEKFNKIKFECYLSKLTKYWHF